MNSIGLSGHFDLVTVNAKTGEVRERRSFDNMILNDGLNAACRGGMQQLQPALGVGTTPPTPNDGGLEQLVYQATNINGGETGIGASAPDWVASSVTTWRIPANAAVGTFTEIGLCQWGGRQPYWCRALILDEHGNVSSITVLPDEYLDITYTLRTHTDLGDRTFTFEINGITYNCTARRAYVGNTGGVSSYNPRASVGVIYSSTGWGKGGAFATQTLGAITSGPSGVGVNSTITDSTTTVPYVENSFTVKRTYNWGLNKMNTDGGIGSIVIDEGNPRIPTQFSFTPKIPKNNTNTLSLTFAVRLYRYGES